MRGDEHYREAERLLDIAETELQGYADADASTEAYYLQQAQWAQQRAQVHATLAHAAAVIEAADHEPNAHRLIGRPMPAGDGDPAYPGTPWGRAFYGDRHLTTNQQEH